MLVQVSGKDLSIQVAPPSSAVALRPLNQIRKYIWIGRRGAAGKATPPFSTSASTVAQVGIDQSRSAKANVFRAPAGPLEHCIDSRDGTPVVINRACYRVSLRSYVMPRREPPPHMDCSCSSASLRLVLISDDSTVEGWR